MPKPRIIVEVSGGVAYVYCDRPDEVEVAVVDHDTDGCTPEELSRLEGERVVITLGNAEPGPGFDQLWRDIHKAPPCEEEEE